MDTSHYQPEGAIKGDSPDETELLEDMARSARSYIGSFKWCPPIDRVLLAFGVGGVVGVFFVTFTRAIEGGDKALWVIEGDLPSAYLVTEEIPGPRAALETYCSLMQDWIDAVVSGKGLDEVFPVEAGRTSENAKLLENRIRFLRKKIVPTIR